MREGFSFESVYPAGNEPFKDVYNDPRNRSNLNLWKTMHFSNKAKLAIERIKLKKQEKNLLEERKIEEELHETCYKLPIPTEELIEISQRLQPTPPSLSVETRDLENPDLNRNNINFIPIFDKLNAVMFDSGDSSVISVLLILNFMVGSGVYYMPYLIKKMGIAGAILMFVIISLFTWLGLVALIETGLSQMIFDFGDLGGFSFGRVGKLLLNFVIVVESMGHILACIIVIAVFSDNICEAVGLNWCASSKGFSYLTLIIVFLFILPNCLRRNYNSYFIQSIVWVGMLCIILVLLIIMGNILSASKKMHPEFFLRYGLISQLGSIIFAMVRMNY
jgi:hypothetical protein